MPVPPSLSYRLQPLLISLPSVFLSSHFLSPPSVSSLSLSISSLTLTLSSPPLPLELAAAATTSGQAGAGGGAGLRQAGGRELAVGLEGGGGRGGGGGGVRGCGWRTGGGERSQRGSFF